MGVEIEVRAERDLSPGAKYALGAWMWEVFGDEADHRLWSGVDWHVLVRVDGELVSHVEIIERTCTVGGQAVRVGGIGGVATRGPWRGQGLASQALTRAMSFMRGDLGLDFGLLICLVTKIPFYRRLGWQVVPGPLFYDQPGGKVKDDGPVMVWCRGQAAWPAGEIDLCGLPW